MTTVNKFEFNNAVLKGINDRDKFLTGQIKSTQTEYTPDGNLRSRFIASRQVTIYDPALVARLRELLVSNSEIVVNCSGYMTTSVRENGNGAKPTFYDNNIITELEVRP
jgi:hypothetical protein